jgi:flagellum-specific peptidoglycan hydrolase FlgJ
MKIKVLFFLFLLSNSLLFSNELDNKESEYIKQYEVLAKSLSEEFGIPYQVIMSIALVESGAGSTKLAKQYHNHFGFVGKNPIAKSRYKWYENDEQSYRDFCEKMAAKKFYPQLKGNPDYKAWILKISKTGYSAKPKQWRAHLYQSIKRNNL